MTNTTINAKRPTHAVYQVIGEGETARWNRIGAGWTNKDGKGFNLTFDSYPAHGRVVLREIDKSDASADDQSEQAA